VERFGSVALADRMVDEVFPEVERQLELRVRAQTAPIEVLTIDRVDNKPIEN
jgi:uncharacterized protein (TIGR03435 family)